jgi:hypothetical protein
MPKERGPKNGGHRENVIKIVKPDLSKSKYFTTPDTSVD